MLSNELNYGPHWSQ